MTPDNKIIEQQANESWVEIARGDGFADSFTPTRQLYYESGYVNGAKARGLQFLTVINALRDDIKKLGDTSVEMFPVDLEEWSNSVLAKTEQMIKEPKEHNDNFIPRALHDAWVKQLGSEYEQLKSNLKIAVEALEGISKTKINGANIYAGADSMVFDAQEAISKIGEL